MAATAFNLTYTMQRASRLSATLRATTLPRRTNEPSLDAPVRRRGKRYTPAAIMARSRLFQDYQRAFAAANGLTPVLVEPDTTILIEWPAGTANPFCARLAGTHKACVSCRAFQAELAATAVVRSAAGTRQCFAGLSETAVPVRYGNRILALLRMGQVRLRPSTDEEMRHIVQEMTAASRSLNRDALAAELKATRTFDLARYNGLVRLLEIFSCQLAEWFVRQGIAEAPRPSPAVTRVKEWLCTHYHEPIALDDAAKAAGLSRWYVSRMVHKDTGMQFREYVVQIRLDRAKHLLAHDDMKINAIAACVGFQSISQFNRAFRAVHGQSAGAYRRARAAREKNGMG